MQFKIIDQEGKEIDSAESIEEARIIMRKNWMSTIKYPPEAIPERKRKTNKKKPFEPVDLTGNNENNIEIPQGTPVDIALAVTS